MKAPPYLASEDSALLRRALEGHSGQACLEIGAGNGGNLVAVSKDFELVVGTDLVRPGMQDWSQAGANYLLADLGSCFRDKAFDMVFFNPPYLLSEGIADPAVDAGVDGEVPLGFLKEALRVVKDSGSVVMLLSRAGSIDRFEAECSRRNFRLLEVGSKRFFFEELGVFQASLASPDARQGVSRVDRG